MACTEQDTFKQPASEHITCPICFKIMTEPVSILCMNLHVFGKDCISTWFKSNSSCPTCRGNINIKSLYKQHNIYNMIQDLPVGCNSLDENKEKKCDWIGKLTLVANHKSVDCGFTQVTCTYCKNFKCMRKNLQDHIKVCDFRPESCKHCGLPNQFNMMDQHYIKCPEIPVSCIACNKQMKNKDMTCHTDECDEMSVFCKYKCRELIVRKDLAKHYAENTKVHLEYMDNTFFKNVKEEKHIVNSINTTTYVGNNIVSRMRFPDQDYTYNFKINDIIFKIDAYGNIFLDDPRYDRVVYYISGFTMSWIKDTNIGPNGNKIAHHNYKNSGICSSGTCIVIDSNIEYMGLSCHSITLTFDHIKLITVPVNFTKL
jgi:hypothetical protein